MTNMATTCREYITCDGPGCDKVSPSKRCARCRLYFFCTAECQKAHWKAGHKKKCKDNDEVRTEIVGICSANDKDLFTLSAECYVCLAEPVVDPYVLPNCQHVFCWRCLSEWQRRIRRCLAHATTSEDRSDPQPTCPACRDSLPNAEGSVYTRPLLYAMRANRVGLAQNEQSDLRNKALKELEKLETTRQSCGEAGALLIRAETLLQLEKPAEAEKDFLKLLQLHRKGIEASETVNRMLAKGREALTEGRADEAKEIAEKCKEFSSSNKHRAFHVNQVFYIYLGLATSFEKRESWDTAMGLYDMVTKAMRKSGNDQASIVQTLIGQSRCAYRLGNYKTSIELGKEAIAIDRSWPGVHRCVALSQKAMGKIEASKVTMGRAVSYEAPWDEENKQRVLAIYEQIGAST